MESIVNQNVDKPQFLYKYHSMNLFLMELLVNNSFYMASRSELNDPLDAAFEISINDYLKIYALKKGLPEGDPMIGIQEGLLKIRTNLLLDNSWVDELIDEEYQYRICSFTEDGNNQLMWAHYSNNHNGVCLKLETKKDPKFFEDIQKVEYPLSLPALKDISDIKKLPLFKLKGWEIEKEWRLINQGNKYEFNPELIVEILLGIKVPDNVYMWFVKFVENFHFNVTVNRLKLIGNKIVKVNTHGDFIA